MPEPARGLSAFRVEASPVVHVVARRAWIVSTVALIAALALVVACSSDKEPNQVTITGTEYAFDAAGELKPGLNTLTFRNEGAVDHHMVIFPLAEGQTIDDLAGSLSFDEEGPLPEGIPWSGGVGVLAAGRESNVTLDVAAGDYALLCFLDDGDGVPHAAKGMALTLSAEGDAVEAEPPAPDVTVQASDYAFDIPNAVDAGDVTIRFENKGSEPHEMLLIGLPEGAQLTNEELTAVVLEQAPPPPGLDGPPPFMGGVNPIAPGDTQTVSTNLDAGRYALICFVPNPEGVPHIALGMVNQLEVE